MPETVNVSTRVVSHREAKGMAAKLYPRFEGDLDRITGVLQLLEEKWGFPERVFPYLRILCNVLCWEASSLTLC
eukprot:160629-Amphidinium_carterae.1